MAPRRRLFSPAPARLSPVFLPRPRRFFFSFLSASDVRVFDVPRFAYLLPFEKLVILRVLGDTFRKPFSASLASFGRNGGVPDRFDSPEFPRVPPLVGLVVWPYGARKVNYKVL